MIWLQNFKAIIAQFSLRAKILYELERRPLFLFDRVPKKRFPRFKYSLCAQVNLSILPALLIDSRFIVRALNSHRATLLLILLKPRRSFHKSVDIRLNHGRDHSEIILFLYLLNILILIGFILGQIHDIIPAQLLQPLNALICIFVLVNLSLVLNFRAHDVSLQLVRAVSYKTLLTRHISWGF